MDAIVQQLFAEAAPLAQPVGVLALGGYGRRQLCLHSDIDLLVLFADPIASEGERFLHSFLNPIWDLGLTIGHHVREVHEGSRLAEDKSRFLLALTDARIVAGDATLLDEFTGATEPTRMNRRTLDALRALIGERHAGFNDTLYQLEPDVKEAPGGLRDLLGAQTIARVPDTRASWAGRLGSARAGRGRGISAAGAFHPAPRGQAASQRAQPRAPGTRRGANGLSGIDAAPAG